MFTGLERKSVRASCVLQTSLCLQLFCRIIMTVVLFIKYFVSYCTNKIEIHAV